MKRSTRRKIAGTVAGVLFIAGYWLACEYSNHYSKTAEAIKVDTQGVTFEDSTGFLWTVDHPLEGVNKGDTVTLRMFTSCTDNIHDDQIEEIKTDNGISFKN